MWSKDLSGLKFSLESTMGNMRFPNTMRICTSDKFETTCKNIKKGGNELRTLPYVDLDRCEGSGHNSK